MRAPLRLALSALATLALTSCARETGFAGAGERCVRAIECANGLACVAGRCSADLSGLEGGTLPPRPMDAGGVDAGPPVDAGPLDAGPVDAGPPIDAGPGMDAGPDAGPPDAGPVDAGPPDAGTDAGPDPGMDAGPPDAGTTPDAGSPTDAA